MQRKGKILKLESPPKKVVDVEAKDKEEENNDGINIVVSKKCKEVGITKPTRSAAPKSKGASEKKHTSVKEKREEVTKGTGPEANPLDSEKTS